MLRVEFVLNFGKSKEAVLPYVRLKSSLNYTETIPVVSSCGLIHVSFKTECMALLLQAVKHLLSFVSLGADH